MKHSLYTHVLIVLILCTAFHSHAITQARIDQINQFINDMISGKLTTQNAIQAQEKQLKQGLSARDLDSQYVTKMKHVIQMANYTHNSGNVALAQENIDEINARLTTRERNSVLAQKFKQKVANNQASGSEKKTETTENNSPQDTNVDLFASQPESNQPSAPLEETDQQNDLQTTNEQIP